jgi:hypothetical protein
MMKNVSELCSAGGSPALAMPAEKTAVSEASIVNIHHTRHGSRMEDSKAGESGPAGRWRYKDADIS